MPKSRSTKKKKTTRKSSGKTKTRTSRSKKRTKETKPGVFLRILSGVLITLLIGIFAFSIFKVWDFLGRPGWTSASDGNNRACLELYFLDNAVYNLVPIHRVVELGPDETPTHRAIMEWTLGPDDPNLARIYPTDIEPPRVWIEDNMAYVDLPADIWEMIGGRNRENTFIDALTLTVNAVGDYNSVMLYIDNEPADLSPGGIDISVPQEPPMQFNYVPGGNSATDTKWVTAWFLDSFGRYLTPFTVKTESDEEDGYAAVNLLLGSAPQLARAVAPEGCGLDRIRIESDVATVDINISDPLMVFDDQNIRIFRRAIFLTLRDCCGVEDIKLRFNGHEAESYERFKNMGPLRDDSCWNLEPVPADDTEDETVEETEEVE